MARPVLLNNLTFERFNNRCPGFAGIFGAVVASNSDSGGRSAEP
jgi:hypothetical protein